MSFEPGIPRTPFLDEMIHISSESEESLDSFVSADNGPSTPTGITYTKTENVKNKKFTSKIKKRLHNKQASQRFRIRKRARLMRLSTEQITEEIKNDKYKIDVKRLEQAVKDISFILARELQGSEMLEEGGMKRIKTEIDLKECENLKFALRGLQEKNKEFLDKEILEEGGVKIIKIETDLEESRDLKFAVRDLREKRMLEGGLDKIKTETDLEERGALKFASGGLQGQKIDILIREFLEEGEVKKVKTEVDLKESWTLQSVARGIQENNDPEDNWSLDRMINTGSESEESSDRFMSAHNGFLSKPTGITYAKPKYVNRKIMTAEEIRRKKRSLNNEASRKSRIRKKARIDKLKREEPIEVIKNNNYKSIIKRLKEALYMLGRELQGRVMLVEGGVVRIKTETDLEESEALKFAAGGLREKDVDISYREMLEERGEKRIKTETDLEESEALTLEPEGLRGKKLDELYIEMLEESEEKRIKKETDLEDSRASQFIARGMQVNNKLQENKLLCEVINISSESEESSDGFMSSDYGYPSISKKNFLQLGRRLTN